MVGDGFYWEWLQYGIAIILAWCRGVDPNDQRPSTKGLLTSSEGLNSK